MGVTLEKLRGTHTFCHPLHAIQKACLHLSLKLSSPPCINFPHSHSYHRAHISTFWKILACKSDGS